MLLSESTMCQGEPAFQPHIPKIGFCEEKNRLRGKFLQAIHEQCVLQGRQTKAVIDGDPDLSRFDILLDRAQHKKDRAKYAWIAHVEAHQCGEG